MTRLPPASYLAHLRTESDRFGAVLADCDPEARVPACPDWTAADLLHHLTEVQTFWAGVVTARPAPPAGDDGLPRAASYAAMLAAFADATDRLVAALTGAAPEEEAWTWSPDHTVGFVQRRQAHEALVHRLDAEQAAACVTPLDAVLATDGVQEALDVMFGGKPDWGVFFGVDHWVRVDAVDTDASVWVQLGVFSGTDPESRVSYAGEPDIAVVDDPGHEPDAVVQGEAGVLDAWLWRRTDDAGVRVTGDRDVYARFRAVVDQPIT